MFFTIRVVCVLVYIVFTASSVSAQSWDDDLKFLTPEQKQFQPMGGVEPTGLDDQEFTGHSHAMYKWYEKSCCDRRDCQPVDAKYVTENPDGSFSVKYSGYIIVFTADQLKPRPANAEPDPYWHPCFSIESSWTSGVTPRITGFTPRCIYPPDSSS